MEEQNLLNYITELMEPNLLEFYSTKAIEFSKNSHSKIQNQKFHKILFSKEIEPELRTDFNKPYKIRSSGSNYLKINHVFKGISTHSNLIFV